MAKLTFIRGRVEDIAECERLLPEAFARLADVHLSRDECQKALDVLKEHLNDFDGYPTLYWMLGKVYYTLDKKEKALDYLLRTLQILPEHPAALELVGRIYMETGEHALARSYLKQVSQLDPLGQVDFREISKIELKPEPKARPKSTKSDDTALKGEFATLTMVKLFIRQGHKNQAKRMCKQILQRQPDNKPIEELLQSLEN